MTYIYVITLVKDIILAGAAIAGTVVAFKGLGTWQRQLTGQAEYRLSRRILVSLFKFRDAINGVRHPAIWSHEMPSPPEEEARTMTQEKVRFYGTLKAYQTRLDKVSKERIALYADLLEAEAMWGTELNKLFKEVFDLQHELFIKVRHHLELMDPEVHESSKEAIRKVDNVRRDIMYDDLSDEPDEYKKDLLNAIHKIENYLKPRLIHRKI